MLSVRSDGSTSTPKHVVCTVSVPSRLPAAPQMGRRYGHIIIERSIALRVCIDQQHTVTALCQARGEIDCRHRLPTPPFSFVIAIFLICLIMSLLKLPKPGKYKKPATLPVSVRNMKLRYEKEQPFGLLLIYYIARLLHTQEVRGSSPRVSTKKSCL